jgi:hypothetical protein
MSMHNPRRKVLRFIERPNTQQGLQFSAELACHHILDLGVSRSRPRTMACEECGNERRREAPPFDFLGVGKF